MNVKIFLLMIFLVGLIGISAVGAAENATGDIITTDMNDDVDLEKIDDEAILDENSNDEDIIAYSSNGHDFSALSELINGGSNTIYLEKDYTFAHGDSPPIIQAGEDMEPLGESYQEPLKNGIEINRDVTVYGNGHTVDGQQLARIFKVNGGHVEFINVKFINAKYSAILVETGGNVTVRYCTFTNNGGTAIWSGGSTMVFNSVFTNNNGGDGGAMKGGTANGCTFIGNTATYGGAINGGSAYSNCIFKQNSAKHGGAIYKGYAVDCQFIENSAHDDGGAMYNSPATRCNFTNNRATRGGAIFMGVPKDFDVLQCIFTSNNADDGGAIYGCNAAGCSFITNNANDGGAIYNGNVENSIFVQNQARNDGGAICNGNASNSFFKNNKAESDGGAIFQGNAEDCQFAENSANYGGAMYEGSAIGCNFTGNMAYVKNHLGGHGGAICSGNASGSLFTNNKADQVGGALYECNADNCNFTNNSAYTAGAMEKGNAFDCIFTQNTATMNGGALDLGNASNCLFNNNSAVESGGAISYGNAFGSKFINNTARYGAAISMDSAVNCTFIDNHAQGDFPVMAGDAYLCNFGENQLSDSYGTNIIAADFVVADFTARYGHGDKLLFDIVADGVICNGFNATLDVYKNGSLLGSYHALSGADGGWVVNLEPGTYDVNLSMDKYSANNASVKLIVVTATELMADDFNTSYNNDDSFVVTLVYDADKGVSGVSLAVDLNGELKNYTTDKNGQIRISTKGLTANTYVAGIVFSGNEDYMKSNATARITVSKATTQLGLDAVTLIYNDNNQLVVTLKDGKGNPVSGASVSVNLNGAMTFTTDNNGQVKVSTKGMIPKTYTAKITFNGNDNYLESSKDVKLTVKKATRI